MYTQGLFLWVEKSFMSSCSRFFLASAMFTDLPNLKDLAGLIRKYKKYLCAFAVKAFATFFRDDITKFFFFSH